MTITFMCIFLSDCSILFLCMIYTCILARDQNVPILSLDLNLEQIAHEHL